MTTVDAQETATASMASEALAALVQGASWLAPHVEPAIIAYLASEPPVADAVQVAEVMTEIRDLVQAQLDRLTEYSASQPGDRPVQADAWTLDATGRSHPRQAQTGTRSRDDP